MLPFLAPSKRYSHSQFTSPALSLNCPFRFELAFAFISSYFIQFVRLSKTISVLGFRTRNSTATALGARVSSYTVTVLSILFILHSCSFESNVTFHLNRTMRLAYQAPEYRMQIVCQICAAFEISWDCFVSSNVHRESINFIGLFIYLYFFLCVYHLEAVNMRLARR